MADIEMTAACSPARTAVAAPLMTPAAEIYRRPKLRARSGAKPPAVAAGTGQPAPAAPQWLRALDIARQARVTLRQVEYWRQQGIVLPAGGMQRGGGQGSGGSANFYGYTSQDAVLLRLIGRLRECAVSLPEIRRCLPRLRRAILKSAGAFIVCGIIKRKDRLRLGFVGGCASAADVIEFAADASTGLVIMER